MPLGAGEREALPAASAAPRRELAALREIRESARALLAQGQVEKTWERSSSQRSMGRAKA